MKITTNKYIPFKGFVALTLFNLIIVRKELEHVFIRKKDLIVNHESIHVAQMRDFCKWLPIGGTIFYILYLFEWLYKVLFKFPFSHKAYKDVSFEKEAYANEDNLAYINTRRKFQQWK